MVGALYRGPGAAEGAARRLPWTRDAEVAGPMSGYARFKRLRSTWRYDGAVGCIVTASDGTRGFGATRYDLPVIHTINDHLAPRLPDENPMATERLWDMMMRMATPNGLSGLTACAISAVDLALWDLKGKILGAPVHELAGGPVRDDLACCATGKDTDWHMALGFRGTKLAWPHGPNEGPDGLKRNEDLVARTRKMVGPDIALMLDRRMAFDVEFAVRLAERLRPYGLRWIEDCLLPGSLDPHAALRTRLPWMTLATGEHWYVPHAFHIAAARRLAGILQPDIAWACGFSGCRKIAQTAEAAGLEVILHAGANTPFGQHRSLTSPAIRWAEYLVGAAPGVAQNAVRVYPGMEVPKDGRVQPNGEPGFGPGLTEAAPDAMTR